MIFGLVVKASQIIEVGFMSLSKVAKILPAVSLICFGIYPQQVLAARGAFNGSATQVYADKNLAGGTFRAPIGGLVAPVPVMDFIHWAYH